MTEHLPYALRGELEKYGGVSKIGELHLRAERLSSVTVNGENCPLLFHASGKVLEDILHAVCGGSIYAYRDSIRAGYITLAGGIRMGIAGRAVTEGDALVAVTDLTALCFRIPHSYDGVACEVYRRWLQEGGRGGILVAAPPACGKTTFLKDFIRLASTGVDARRVAVVDTREELCVGGNSGEMVDVLRGYPRVTGLEIALRTLSPEVLVCDEIGAEELIGVRDILYSGVPLIAAVHGSSLTKVRERTAVKALLDAAVFSLGITLTGPKAGWRCDIEVLS